MIIFIQNTYGQIELLTNTQLRSPNSSSLGRYGDIPISYHTGTPQIGVPIYTLEEGTLSLPISLSYHASGVKVLDLASWVGLGWSLQAGGVISRTVRGGPDEGWGTNALQRVGHYRDYGYNSYLTTAQGAVDIINDAAGWDWVSKGYVDGEPDLFFFNFNGYSGKFYFRDDRSVMFLPEQDMQIKVEVNENFDANGVGGFLSFCIITPDGTRYYFGEGDAKEVSNPRSYDNPTQDLSRITSSWYLTRIVSADGTKSITLNYVPENYSYNTINYSETNIGGNRTIIQGVRLSSIVTSHERVDFIANTLREDLDGYTDNSTSYSYQPNTESRRLDAIEIKNTANTFCKKFDFSYSYFNDTQSSDLNYGYDTYDTDRKRLKLDAVQEKSCDGVINVPAYTFSYYDESNVPRRLTLAQDHWGYYNAALGNSSLGTGFNSITDCDIKIEVGANREANWPAMRAGTLQQIQYPTGGHTEFVFEPHDTPVKYTRKLKGEALNFTLTRFPSECSGGNNSSITLNLDYAGEYIAEVNGGTYGGQLYVSSSVASATGGNTTNTCLNIAQTTNVTFNLSASSTSGGSCNLVVPPTAKVYKVYTEDIEEDRIVGGLRIQKIINHDGISTDNDIIKTYEYQSGDNKSTGVLYGRPIYQSVLRNDYFNQLGFAGAGQLGQDPFAHPYVTNGCYSGGQNTSTVWVWTSNGSIFPMQSTQGNHIGYIGVKEILGRRDTSLIGYIDYTYDPGLKHKNQTIVIANDLSIRDPLSTTTCDINTPNYPPAPDEHDFYRGNLLDVEKYTTAGLPIEKKSYRYNYEYEDIGIPGFIVANRIGTYWATFYELKTARLANQTTTTRTYDQSNQEMVTVQESYYDSDYHAMLTRTSSVDSQGDIHEQKIKYPLDYYPSTCTGIVNNCDANYQTALDQFNNNVNDAVANVKAGIITYAAYYNEIETNRNTLKQAREDYIACRDTYRAALQSCLETACGTADTEYKAILSLQQNNEVAAAIESIQLRDGNVLGGVYSTFEDLNAAGRNCTNPDLNTHPYQTYPKKVYQIELDKPLTEASFNPTQISGGSISKDSHYGEYEVEYSFNTDGNLDFNERREGVRTSYIWGYNKLYPIAQIVRADPSQVYVNSFEESGGTSGTSQTGDHYLNQGSYTIPFTPPVDDNTYMMSYWFFQNGSWQFSGELPFNASISSTGTRLDEIRVYPQGAFVTTYTYDPILGMTTSTDAQNRTSYYEYDALGRLILVRDFEGNILQQTEYHYRGE